MASVAIGTCSRHPTTPRPRTHCSRRHSRPTNANIHQPAIRPDQFNMMVCTAAGALLIGVAMIRKHHFVPPGLQCHASVSRLQGGHPCRSRRVAGVLRAMLSVSVQRTGWKSLEVAAVSLNRRAQVQSNSDLRGWSAGGLGAPRESPTCDS